MKYFKGGMLIL